MKFTFSGTVLDCKSPLLFDFGGNYPRKIKKNLKKKANKHRRVEARSVISKDFE